MEYDFIQIGANIGNTESDIIWQIIREKKWKGIFVEPLPESFKLLKENYKDIKGCKFENVAITDYEGEVTLYYQDAHHSQQASIISNWWRNDKQIIVPCMTLESLIKKYKVQSFDLLIIDAEGSDGDIICSTNFSEIKPKYIRFESIHSKSKKSNIKKYNDIIQHLKSFGYVEIEDLYKEYVVKGEYGIDTMVMREQ